ncbi:quinoprotein dehydrogenase-associated SoxYZ-like carrier [Rhodobacter ferrooxidans]|uniref:Sulphur oxidation protein SoxZ n=1 Tax=Rhodobacter ferrooxidans TaxID=371731 RepID=C8S585_9RHOB|nr:quinoprotein dehydrogenase-associated SoxYZ-like carrier [Rhodobacter sp. SW2]EEW23881.1 Sulphur oxidation protein SoxZ [Rhodobacter sp. SW2]
MKQLLAGLCLMVLAQSAMAQTADNPLIEGETWQWLREQVTGDTVLLDGAGLFAVSAPYRAEDAATVPVAIEQTDASAGPITALKLVIDENPSPLAAEIRFGPAMHPLKFETRVRVNAYSNIRVIAETATGSYMTGRYVKSAGGCSAPATKDPAAALANMGEMKLRLFGAPPAPAMSTARREAQIMIRHPNYTGLQRDAVSLLFINAHFISTLEVRQGDDLLFAMQGGISISENPVFRFSYADNGAPSLTVHAVDTEGNVFDQVLPKMPPA